jgi:hypothetical protein
LPKPISNARASKLIRKKRCAARRSASDAGKVKRAANRRFAREPLVTRALSGHKGGTQRSVYHFARRCTGGSLPILSYGINEVAARLEHLKRNTRGFSGQWWSHCWFWRRPRVARLGHCYCDLSVGTHNSRWLLVGTYRRNGVDQAVLRSVCDGSVRRTLAICVLKDPRRFRRTQL